MIKAADGKRRLTDVATTEELHRKNVFRFRKVGTLENERGDYISNTMLIPKCLNLYAGSMGINFKLIPKFNPGN